MRHVGSWLSVSRGLETVHSHLDIILCLLPDPYIVDDGGVIWGSINEVIRSRSRFPPPRVGIIADMYL